MAPDYEHDLDYEEDIICYSADWDKTEYRYRLRGGHTLQFKKASPESTRVWFIDELEQNIPPPQGCILTDDSGTIVEPHDDAYSIIWNRGYVMKIDDRRVFQFTNDKLQSFKVYFDKE